VVPTCAVFRQSTITSITNLGGSAEATAINKSGVVVGFSLTAASEQHAFVFSGGITHDLDFGGHFSVASGINASGQVVGDSVTTTNASESHAFLFAPGSPLDLGTLGGSLSTASAINDVGQVVGASTLASGFASGLSLCEWGNDQFGHAGRRFQHGRRTQ